MDRFVWFVLLVVMTHLVTEFTRVTGYARGQRQELVLINDVSKRIPLKQTPKTPSINAIFLLHTFERSVKIH